MTIDFDRVLTHGNLVDINVGMWSAEKKIQPEDLGLDPTKVSEVFTLGRKKLIPLEELAKFKHFDYKARSILIKYSYTTEFGDARFVPKKCFVEFAQELDKVIVDYNKTADDFVKNYERYRLDMRQHFVQAAYQAFDRAAKLNGFSTPQDKFINSFLERVDKYYPDADKIRSKFRMEYMVFRWALPDISSACYADIAEEADKIKLMRDAWEKQMSRKVDEFVTGILTEQRAKVQCVLQHFSDNLGQRKKVSKQSFDSIRNVIEEYEKMDIMEDEKFLTLLKQFRDRAINRYAPRNVRYNSTLRKMILDELSVLLGVCSNKNIMDELIKNYREKIKI